MTCSKTFLHIVNTRWVCSLIHLWIRRQQFKKKSILIGSEVPDINYFLTLIKHYFFILFFCWYFCEICNFMIKSLCCFDHNESLFCGSNLIWNCSKVKMNSNDIRNKFGISFLKALPIDKWSVYCPSGWSFSFRRWFIHWKRMIRSCL